MKRKTLGIMVASLLISGNIMAKESGQYMALGYGSTSIDGSTTMAPTFDLGIKFGQTYKQTIATKFILAGTNDDWTDGEGNLLEMYYSLGYEIFKDTIVSAKVGYTLQDLGTDARTHSSAMSGGFSYGLMAKYALSDSFDVLFSYTQANLSYVSWDYKADTADMAISYTF